MFEAVRNYEFWLQQAPPFYHTNPIFPYLITKSSNVQTEHINSLSRLSSVPQPINAISLIVWNKLSLSAYVGCPIRSVVVRQGNSAATSGLLSISSWTFCFFRFLAFFFRLVSFWRRCLRFKALFLSSIRNLIFFCVSSAFSSMPLAKVFPLHSHLCHSLKQACVIQSFSLECRYQLLVCLELGWVLE